MRTTRRTTALVLGAASIALLQAKPGHSQGVDADVPVVENQRAGEAPLLWTVEAEPVVEIGGSETDQGQQLFQVVDAGRLEDSRIVVANAGDHELRFYDANGSHLFAVGGEGEAPGEFRRFSSFQVGAHDSIHVYDQDLQRVTVFDAQGEVVRTVSVPLEARPPPSYGGSGTVAGTRSTGSASDADPREPSSGTPHISLPTTRRSRRGRR